MSVAPVFPKGIAVLLSTVALPLVIVNNLFPTKVVPLFTTKFTFPLSPLEKTPAKLGNTDKFCPLLIVYNPVIYFYGGSSSPFSFISIS